MSKDKLFFKSIILAALLAVTFFSLPAFKEIGRKNKIKDEINNLQKEKEELERGNYFSGEKNAYFETNEYKERISKKRLNMQKKGENVVLIKHGPEEEIDYDEEGKKVEQNVLSAKEEESVANYKKWWNHFFKY